MDSSASSPSAPPPSTTSSSTTAHVASPRPLTRSEPATNPYPTTFVQADSSSFKQVVQMLTGSPSPMLDSSPSAVQQPASSPTLSSRLHSIPPIKPGIAKKTGSGSSGFKLYERRNSLKNLKINPLHPLSALSGQPSPGFSGLKPGILSPSILDFPSLALSPVTPLTHDPFTRSPTILGPNCHLAVSPDEGSSGSASSSVADTEAEERGIREKGFFLHPSPSTTPRDPKPRLLPLFPVTSPRVSGGD
ncbi:hypothetical protein MLD38_016747 [Melastoma candidum]|uniref:Uncharacterized protein n=1 Tax=Melastoma candidum TaxID=119954 RepID=A0ACB9QNF2_9MYRT|nr:hypothetical protein MLD38_016747 [Melastoma candidum]